MAALFFASCGENTPSADKPGNVADTTLPKAKWNDPGRGKIFDKTNYVQIPITAYEHHIFGEVKSVTYKDYKVAENGVRALEDSGYNVYDKNGHLIDQNEYAADGKAKWNCVYKYNETCPVEWIFKFEDPMQNSTITFKCDEKGRKTEQIEVAADKDRSRRLVYKYDDRGNEIEIAEYSGENKTPWTTTYKYDSKDNQVEYLHKDETGRVLMKRTKEYDSLGNGISGGIYSSETELKGKWTATFDNKGRRIENSSYKKDGTLLGQAKMQYDDWDNIIEYTTYKADGSIDNTRPSFYTEFEYDSKGNPTKETWYTLKDGKKVVTNISEKKYEYY
jgi:hypothetical protein